MKKYDNQILSYVTDNIVCLILIALIIILIC